MALFGLKKRKKEDELTEEITPVPSFQNAQPMQFPEISEIKNAIKPFPSSPIRLEEPKIMFQPMTFPKMPESGMSEGEEKPVVSRQIIPRTRVTREIDDTIEPREEQPVRETSIAKLREPIFVKIDKFEDALSNFEEIKRRLHESFELLERIKRIRGKEEEEIESWEKEIEEIKTKMFELDKKLFSRVEF